MTTPSRSSPHNSRKVKQSIIGNGIVRPALDHPAGDHRAAVDVSPYALVVALVMGAVLVTAHPMIGITLGIGVALWPASAAART
jgi:hypothetical protein